MTGRNRLLAGFGSTYIGLETDVEWLAIEWFRRWPHAVGSTAPLPPVVLHLTVTELAPSCLELRDSSGRCERGGLEPIAFLTRKWATEALVAAHPELVWVHAAAASLGTAAILLAGPAGAGKSTLLVQLLERGWCLLGDDAVALQPRQWTALPLPFAPEPRMAPAASDDESHRFVDRAKTLTAVTRDRIAANGKTVGAVVLPEYSADDSHPVLSTLSVVAAAQALATHRVPPSRGPLAHLFALAKDVPCYRLRYHAPAAAAHVLTQLLPDRDTVPD